MFRDIILLNVCPETKTCVYDCIYCPYGSTLTKVYDLDTVEMDFNIDNFASRYRDILSKISRDDLKYIVINGEGDPTLNPYLKDIMRIARSTLNKHIPLAIYAPGGTFIHSSIRETLLSAETIIIRLDSPDEKRFRSINRAHSMLRLEEIIYGMMEFSMEYTGILKGILTLLDSPYEYTSNVDKESMRRLVGIIKKIGIDELYIEGYIMDKSGAKTKMTHSDMIEIREFIEDNLSIEISYI